VAVRRFALLLVQAFALTALGLAAAGIYGVLAGSVVERTREIGIRSALGATRRNILALVVREGMFLTVLGLAIGLIGAVATSQALSTMLFGVSHLDPATYLGVVALMVSVSLHRLRGARVACRARRSDRDAAGRITSLRPTPLATLSVSSKRQAERFAEQA
jgi:predicted lysophospholipase L1 biosynthesis ABC-type transport system permease subunit